MRVGISIDGGSTRRTAAPLPLPLLPLLLPRALLFDSKAYEHAGKQYDETYYESLWKETGLFTTQLLQESSRTLASFIYSAWLEAGKPEIPISKGGI